MGSWYGDRYQFYSAPTYKEGLPDIGYTVVMWETDPFVADFAGNPWDMDPDAEEQQTQGT